MTNDDISCFLYFSVIPSKKSRCFWLSNSGGKGKYPLNTLQKKSYIEQWIHEVKTPITAMNLKDYYPWYLTNEYIEVPDEVAAELRAGKLAEAAHAERVRYNKAYYSLDCDDGIEYSACVHEPSPQELLERMDRFCHLWNALNSLPEIQGRRVDAHLILGKSYREIARDEGVDKSAVRSSVLCGIEAMKKYLRKNL